MMEEQLEKSRQETEENRKACKKVKELMAGLDSYNANGLLVSSEESGSGDGKKEAVNGAGGAVETNGERGEKAPGDEKKDNASWEALQQAGLV